MSVGPVLAQTTELTMWTFIDPAGTNVRSKSLAQVLKTFEAKNPAIKVKPNVIEWTQISPSLLRASQARQVPDLVMLYSPFVAGHVAAGTITPLDELLAKDGRDNYVIFPEGIDAQGHVFAVPYEMRVGGFMYNGEVFQKAGAEPPKTLDDMTTVARKLRATGDMGLVLGMGAREPSGGAEWWFPTLVGMGATVIDKDGKVIFDSPQAEKLLQWVYNLVYTDKVMALDTALVGSDEAQDLFIARRSAIRPAMTHRLNFVRTEMKAGRTIKMTRMVTFDPAKPAPAMISGWMLAIPKGAKNPKAAALLLQHWTSPEIQVYQAQTAGYVPIRKDALKDAWFKSDDAGDIRWALDYAAQVPMTLKFPENTETLYKVTARMFEKVLTNQMKPKEALLWAQDEYNNLSQR
jgi:multiple sugar transport system substrate-binding protein